MVAKFELAFTRCQNNLKTVKNVMVAEFELAFTRCQNNLKAVENLTVKNSLQDFDVKEMCQSISMSISLVPKASKNVLFSSFSSFYTMPFQKCAG